MIIPNYIFIYYYDTGIGQGRVTDNLKKDIELMDDTLRITDEKSIAMVSDPILVIVVK